MGKYLLSIAMLLIIFCCASPSASRTTMTMDDFFASKAAMDGELDEAMTDQAISMVKQQLHSIQLGLERWSVDDPDGFYPHSINQLVSPMGEWDSYLPAGFYANPFTAGSADELDAMCVPFGWSELAPGNFSYLTHYDEQGNVTSYMLIGYGPERDRGWDLDGDGEPEGMIITLSTGQLGRKGKRNFYDNGRMLTLEHIAAD